MRNANNPSIGDGVVFQACRQVGSHPLSPYGGRQLSLAGIRVSFQVTSQRAMFSARLMT